MGCDDGNPCTDDSCGATGCENSNNTASCDDQIFCNGPDSCMGGSCDVHAGDPCMGNSQCQGTMCTGCQTTADCPGRMEGPWSTCSFSDTCSEMGTRSRSVTTFSCAGDGSCDATVTMETDDCPRTTTGNNCGTPTNGTWSACGGFSSDCDTGGTQSRSVTLKECQGGICADVPGMNETRACPRATDGVICGDDVLGAWSNCDYGTTCGESGTRSRTRMARECDDGACIPKARPNVTDTCSRSTTGDMCGATQTGNWSACTYANQCINTGSRSRTDTILQCASGNCASMPMVVNDTAGCNRNTTNNSCGADTFSNWSACSYASACATTGTRTRTRTSYVCIAGGCASTDVQESDSSGCNRSTTGDTCRAPSCTGWSSCNTLFECQGFQIRTCTTSTCNSSGMCINTTAEQNRNCTAANGTSCGPGGCMCQNGACVSSGGGQICNV